MQTQRSTVQSTCEECGSTYTHRSDVKRQRFCSMTCAGAAKSTQTEVECATCGAPLTRKPSEIAAYHQSYCSRGCAAAGQVIPLIDRFLAKIDKNGPVPAHRPELGPCWVWTGIRDSYGYGRISVSPAGKRRRWIKAHRLAYAFAYGVIAGKDDACHHCDYPPCVRPYHLFAAPHADNVKDMGQKRRGGRTLHPERFPVGSAVKQSVLTEVKVIEMRLLRAEGVHLKALATRFGVSRNTVKRIVYRQAWKHV